MYLRIRPIGSPLSRAGLALAAVPAVVLPLAFAPVASAAATAPHHTRVIASCTRASYEPSRYIFACGDANVGMIHVKYTRWSTTSATGSGTYYYNTCQPNCASGKFKRERGTKIRLHHVVTTKKYGRLFTKATLAYPNGKHQTYTLPRSAE